MTTEPASIRYNDLISLERLKEVLHYNPETGFFVWLVSLGWKGGIGKPAGSLTHGYIQIMIDGKMYLAHRLAWFYVTGEWPKDKIDHKDTIRYNNIFKNLREATGSQNNQNSRKREGCRSKFKGASWHNANAMWEARIKLNRKTTHLGCYHTEEEAHAAYCKAADEKFNEYARAA